jgi:hypothetical protein
MAFEIGHFNEQLKGLLKNEKKKNFIKVNIESTATVAKASY